MALPTSLPRISPRTHAHPPAAAEARVLFARLHALPEGAQERDGIRETLVRMHLPLSQQLASRYRGRGEPMEDLLQAANLGLVKAVDRFDPAYGTEFSSYAVPTMLGELRKHFRDTAWRVHVPRRSQERRLAVASAVEDLTQRSGRPPTVGEIARHLRVAEEDVLEGVEAARAHQSTSLDMPLTSDEGGPTLGDALGEEDRAIEGVEYAESLRPLIAALPERSRRILLMRFYGNYTQSQIAAKVGVSQMHVSRLLARALAQLREELLKDE
jgi:RNA polymerase sigma-B factor